jgi:hypothetical protein
MLETGFTVNERAKVFSAGEMVPNTMGNGLKIGCKELEHTLGLMVIVL